MPVRTATHIYLTVDTEYSAALFQKCGRASRVQNFDSSIAGKALDGAAGIFYEMDVLDRHGLKGVFFVDPMPALVWGIQAIADIVEPIVVRGHDVQLHLHSEWLEFAGASNPLGMRTGRNIANFSFDEQCILLDWARRTLIAAGAPEPIAFRAGNYGANDDTLRALASIGMCYDSSHCPGIAVSECELTLAPDDRNPVEHCGVIEVPIGCIEGPHGSLRHFQVTALTAAEVIAALRHAARQGQSSMTLVCHSFELLSRNRRRINRIVRRRFERLCAALATTMNVATATYSDLPPVVDTVPHTDLLLPHSPLRTLHRYTEQALSNMLYGAR